MTRAPIKDSFAARRSTTNAQLITTKRLLKNKVKAKLPRVSYLIVVCEIIGERARGPARPREEIKK